MTTPPGALGVALDTAAREAAERTVLIDGLDGAEISYGRLGTLIGRFNALLDARGVATGAEGVVMSVLPNSAEQMVAFLGVAASGRSFAPLSAESTAREAEHWVRLVRPRICLMPSGGAFAVSRSIADMGIEIVEVPLGAGFDWLPETAVAVTPEPGRLYTATSGTTGAPRVLVCDTDALWASAVAFGTFHSFLGPASRFLNLLPMCHLSGLFNLGLIPLAIGGSVAITEVWSGRAVIGFWQHIDQYDVNVIWLFPGLMRALLDQDALTRQQDVAGRVHPLKACFLGLSPVGLATKRKFETTFKVPVLENYGLSETTFLSSETLTTRSGRTERSVGQPLPWVDLTTRPIPDPEAGPDAAGNTEILARTPYLFLGYLSEDGLTPPELSPEGYFATGDLGRIRGGMLELHGRQGDVIKMGNELIFLRDLELLAEQSPLVQEACAVGMPHALYGMSPVLFVRFHSRNGETDKVLQSFRPWLHANLARSRWPEKIISVAEFPRTRTGKILREQMVRRALENQEGTAT